MNEMRTACLVAVEYWCKESDFGEDVDECLKNKFLDGRKLVWIRRRPNTSSPSGLAAAWTSDLAGKRCDTYPGRDGHPSTNPSQLDSEASRPSTSVAAAQPHAELRAKESSTPHQKASFIFKKNRLRYNLFSSTLRGTFGLVVTCP